MPDPSTLRFEVQPGDVWYADPSTKNRSEVAMQDTISDGTQINISYGMDVEAGAANTAAFCILGQFHQAQGTSVSDLGPPFSIQLVGEKMSVVIGYTDASGANVTKTIYVDNADIVRGHDYAMNIQVVFGPDGSGSLVVTRDGLTLVSYTGPLGYEGEGAVYWKEGIYRAAAPETMAVDYSNLAVATSTPSSSGSGNGVQSYTQYDSTGEIATSVTVNPDGSTTTDKYTNGILSESTTVHADGSRDVYDYGVTGQNYVSDHRIYNAAGTLTQFTAMAADGSKMVSDYIVTGQVYGSDQLSYNANGILLNGVYYNTDGSTTIDKYNSSGALIQYNVLHADGSRDVYDYGLTGQSYVSDHRIYNASGTLTEYIGIAADGSKLVNDYAVTGQSYTADQLSYNAAGTLVLAIYYNADGSTTTEKLNAGVVYQTTIVHADASRDVYDYGLVGQTYVSDHRVYNAAGILTEYVGFAADGSKIVCDYAVSGKAYTSDQLSYSANGTLATAIYYNTDGSTTTEKCNAGGSVIQTTIVHADGSHDVYDYGLTGAYVSDHRIYNAAGTLVEYVGFAADGSKIVCDYAVAGKSYTSDQLNYNASSTLTSAIFNNNNGSTTTDKYNAAGSLTQTYIAYANGSHEVYDYGIVGQSYVADHRVYNSAGTLTEYVTIAASGAEKVSAYASGLQIGGGGAGNDTFNSYGGDTFVFKGSFGSETVSYFHAGEVANHDKLVFSASAVADLSHLHMVQSGNNVLITVDAHDTVTLTGVKIAALTSHDFIFS